MLGQAPVPVAGTSPVTVVGWSAYPDGMRAEAANRQEIPVSSSVPGARDSLNEQMQPKGEIILSDEFQHNDRFSRWTRRRIDKADHDATDQEMADRIYHGLVPAGNRIGAHFHVPDSGTAYRSELAFDPPAGGLGTFGNPYGRYETFLSHCLGPEWTSGDVGTIIAQWHGAQIGGENKKPPIAILVKDEEWKIKIHSLNNDGSVGEKSYSLGSAMVAEWQDWKVDITWSTLGNASSGRVMVKVRRGSEWVELVNHSGANHYHQRKTPYLKVGIYRAAWNPHHPAPRQTGAGPIDVFYRGVEVTRH